MLHSINFDLYTYLIWAISAVALVFLFVLSFYYLAMWSISGKPVTPVPHSDKYSKFAVLIAARDESKVIASILKSLKDQTYNPKYFDVWVIVEREDDPTVQIVKDFGFNYFVRDELTDSRKTKGFALQECIRHFDTEGIDYDAYMIFDADNVIEANYLEAMNDLRQTGVKVGLGYRNFTNANHNWLTVGSAIMFTYMNQVTGRGRSILFHKMTLMGTGYYVDSDIIKDAGGWIFTGMTEDIQLSTYCYYHDVYMCYYPLVHFYDEQAPDFKTVHNQHVRWLAGYIGRRKPFKVAGVNYDYHPKNMQKMMILEFKYGLIPFVVFNAICVILGIVDIVFGILCAYVNPDTYRLGMIFGNLAYQIFMWMLIFIVPSAIVIYRENKVLKLSKKNCVLAMFTYGFFFYEFILSFIDLFLHPSKKKNWKRVDHSGEITHSNVKDK